MSRIRAEVEASIEDKYVEYAAGWDVLAVKKKVEGQRNWPDRENLVGYGYMFYIEFKRSADEEPRPAQISRFKKLRARGYHVYVCHDLEDAKNIMHYELRYFYTFIYPHIPHV